jgi:hypothetical protein
VRLPTNDEIDAAETGRSSERGVAQRPKQQGRAEAKLS